MDHEVCGDTAEGGWREGSSLGRGSDSDAWLSTKEDKPKATHTVLGSPGNPVPIPAGTVV